jgi:hypothetical protein
MNLEINHRPCIKGERMHNRRWKINNSVSWPRAVFFLFIFLVLGALAAPPPLLAWIQVGDEVEAVFESPHPYVGQGLAAVPVRQDVIRVPGASYVSVHFDKFDLAAGDRVVLSDPAGGTRHVYENLGYMDKGGDFWGMSVSGDTLIVSLYAQGKGPGKYGYRIDRYAHGYPLADLPGSDSPEAVCGTVDYQDAVCYETSESDAYQKSRAVVRLLKNGSAHCTGWLVSCDNHIFTNEHCVTSQTELDQIEFQFMYQKPGCGSGTATVELQLQGGTFIQDNADLDYCLLIPNLDGNDPQSVYGYIQIDNRLPDIDERMYIVNHPSGQPKKLSLESTHAQDQTGYCEVYSTDEPPCAGGPGDIGYYCDTEGGSSGSPVLSAASNKAIALHHCADCPNRGVPVTAICDDLEGVLPICSGCISECFDNDGDGYGYPGTPLCTYPEQDCDDADPDVNPGVTEGPPGDLLCGDTVDNDCDGAADLDDIECVACVDGDGDGYGVEASAYCTYPEEDCDDTDPDVNPGAVEGPYDDPTCEDGLDNDCDGLTDLGDLEDCVEFYAEALEPHTFTGGGTAMGWNGDDACWSYTLPFTFPYFLEPFDAVYVCSNGFLDFTSSSATYTNSLDEFKGRKMIALIWDDLKTNGVGEDIYVHQPTADSLAIRWDGSTYSGSLPVDAEVILYESGGIQFNYGDGNTGLTPTIGISRGDGVFFYVSPHDGASALTLADSDRYVPVDLECDDADGDGYGFPPSIACASAEEDCDDTNPDVNPGALEGPFGDPVCSDTIDNDCDGDVDGADSGCAACVDNDGDGYGVPGNPSCTHPEEDCDDANAGVNPGAAEICNDAGVDEDCDGLTDSADPDCAPSYASAANAEASTYGSGSLTGSGTFNELVLVVLPLGVVVFLRRIRRRNR